ncbi:hypothetical protein [Lactococcus allomyrinae]|uniref:Uncharacterized protein n=1 Tax=Lactococcus allomyrinae TaxID=2419773 RepID=A0A387BKP7_9LACT|nr:hypothetical protein [Lactococcus allomyrinae]AYG01607.1 hypothetical protein D7I46_11385 [Lactococcus allomyrinae]
MTDWSQINRLTLKQYRIMTEALKLRQIDEEFAAHREAYLGFVVKAERQVGKYKTKAVYDKFEKFYDYKAQIAKVGGEFQSEDNSQMQTIKERFREYIKKKKTE